jgi:uncharacterized Zn-binding protein involved in type VI secretion
MDGLSQGGVIMKCRWISMLVSVALVIGMATLSTPKPALAATCNSTKSGNWNDSTVWSCGAVPGASDDVYIRSGDKVTLTQDESVRDLHLNNTSGQQRLVTGAYTLSVNGKMRAFSGDPPGTSGDSSSTLNWINTSGGGKIKLVDTSRTVFNSGEWSADARGWKLEIALNSGQTASAQTNVKAGEILITSGTLSMATNDLRPDGGSAGTGTLTIGSGATLVISGAIARTGTANEPFATFTNNGTLNTSNSSDNVWPSGTICSFAANSTVEYSRTGAQTIQTPSGSSYGNLILSGSGTKTSAASPLNVQGSLTISAGTFSAPAQTNVAGNFTNNGTFTAGTGTVTFSGTSAQTIGGTVATTFNNLTINQTGAPGVTMNQNATVNGVLALTSGDLTTGSNTLTMGSSATSSGDYDVVGNVKRTSFSVGTTYSFGNPNISLNFASGGTLPTEVTVNLAKTQPVTYAVDRTYTINQTGGSGFSATLRLRYKDSELHLANGATENNLYILKNVSGSWVKQTRSAIDTTNNWVETSGVSSFSQWTISGNNPTTAITLLSFTATSPLPAALPVLGLVWVGGLAAVAALGIGAVLVRRRRE